MEILQKKTQLRDILRTTLEPLIDNDYIFIDLPYYKNIGDVLIWNGTEAFLKGVKHKCLYRASFYTFDFRQLPPSAIIVLQGGGNWGDLWHEHNTFRKEIVKKYPDNRIIILPQTVFYENKLNQEKDFKIFSEHPKLIVCARDNYSYEVLRDGINCRVILLPDMAFFLDFPLNTTRTGKNLFFKRNDKELKMDANYSIIPSDAETHDWPTYENTLIIDKIISRIENSLRRVNPNFSFARHKKIENYLYYYILRQEYQKAGVRLLSSYDVIFSTRLHAAILGILLGKKVVFIDNSYGKNSNFYHTWLEDLDSITLVESK